MLGPLVASLPFCSLCGGLIGPWGRARLVHRQQGPGSKERKPFRSSTLISLIVLVQPIDIITIAQREQATRGFTSLLSEISDLKLSHSRTFNRSTLCDEVVRNMVSQRPTPPPNTLLSAAFGLQHKTLRSDTSPVPREALVQACKGKVCHPDDARGSLWASRPTSRTVRGFTAGTSSESTFSHSVESWDLWQFLSVLSLARKIHSSTRADLLRCEWWTCEVEVTTWKELLFIN